jgi:hypothetical protein
MGCPSAVDAQRRTVDQGRLRGTEINGQLGDLRAPPLVPIGIVVFDGVAHERDDLFTRKGAASRPLVSEMCSAGRRIRPVLALPPAAKPSMCGATVSTTCTCARTHCEQRDSARYPFPQVWESLRVVD